MFFTTFSETGFKISSNDLNTFLLRKKMLYINNKEHYETKTMEIHCGSNYLHNIVPNFIKLKSGSDGNTSI